MSHKSNVRRVALARFISRVGGEAAFFVGIWGRAAYEFDASPGELAVLMGVLGVSALIGSAAAGVLVDRFGPRRVLVGGEVLFAPAALALILPSTMVELTVAVAAAGVLGHLVFTAVASFPPYLAEGEADLVRVNALVEVGGTAAFVAGPAVGGVLAATLGLNWIFVLDAATSLVAVALVARVQTRPLAATEQGRRNALTELVEGFRFTYTAPVVRFSLIAGTLTWLSFGAFGALEPIFFREVLGVGPAALGYVNAVFGLGMVGGSALLGRLPSGFVSARSITVLTVLVGIGAVVYTGTSDLRVVLVGAVGWGVVLGMQMPALRTLAQLGTPDGLQGRVMGAMQTQQTVGELLPLTFVPVLALLVGVQAVLVGSGLVLALVAVLLLRPAVRLDRAVVRPPSPPEPALPLVAGDRPMSSVP